MANDGRPDLVAEAEADRIEIEALKKAYKDSTGLTWLWSLLFGPIYFWVHGFIAMGFVIILICVPTYGVGILAAPFLAYHAWNRRATRKAEYAVAASKLRR